MLSVIGHMVIGRRLHLAFADDGRQVRTYAGGGGGPLRRRRLADVVLPTGEITLGYPGTYPINVPSAVRPKVAPGTYPVYLSMAEHSKRMRGFAYLSVHFTDGPVTRWRAAGSFFTDSGLGCILDSSLNENIRAKGTRMTFDKDLAWRDGVYSHSNGSLLLDEASGANAIVWFVGDGRWECFLGYTRSARLACLVIDGRRPCWWEFWR